MSGRTEIVLIWMLGLGVAAVGAAGIPVRATHAAQTTADEPQYLMSALSLWEDGDLDVSDELRGERYRPFHEVDLPQQTLLRADGSRISPHDPLLPLLLAVPMGLWGWGGAKMAMAIMGGALAALMAWTAIKRFRVKRSTAFSMTALFALSPPLAIYSTQVYPEIPAAIALLAGLAAVLGPFGRGGRIALVIAVVLLPWLAVKYLPVAAVLAILGLIRAGRGRRLGLFSVLAGFGVLYVVGHLVIYGGLTAYATGDYFVAGEFTAVGTRVNLWGRSTRLIGLLIDRGFGIGAWQPAFLLFPLVAGWALGRRFTKDICAVVLVAVGWLVATFVALTMHGWWFPGRQLIVVIPIAVLLIAAWVDEGRRRAHLVMVLGLPGVIAFGYLLAEGLARRLTWVVDFGATENPLYGALGAILPDYMMLSTRTWVLHGLWVAVALGIGWWGWRGGSGSRYRSDRGKPDHPIGALADRVKKPV